MPRSLGRSGAQSGPSGLTEAGRGQLRIAETTGDHDPEVTTR